MSNTAYEEILKSSWLNKEKIDLKAWNLHAIPHINLLSTTHLMVQLAGATEITSCISTEG